MIIQRFKDLKIERLCCNLLIVIALCSLLPVVSSAQMTWYPATNSADWDPRSSHTSVVFDGKMWVIGGAVDWFPFKGMNDVWWSTDGISWTCETESAPWSVRCCHTSVVFDGKMWVIGGMHWAGTNSIFFNDVWLSTDGDSWVCADSSAPWSGRANHQSVVFNNRMWVIAGASSYSPPTVPREVWCSTDGDSWVCVTDSAPWEGREAPALEVYHDTMWLMGGLSTTRVLNDVWYSTDGANWTCKIASAPWSVRFAHKAAVFQDSLWITGGLNLVTNMNDAWSTADGGNWTCADSSAEWRPRTSHTFLVYDSMLWVMGGDSTWDFLTTNDVWYSTGLGIEEHSTPYVQSLMPNATIVRGVLYLPSTSSIKRQALSVLLDITGRKVADLKSGANDIRHLSPGVYFVRQKENKQTSKVVIMR